MTSAPAPLPRRFRVALDVRFPEVDSYGVVWHGHYLQYFEVVRNALCAAGGLTPGEALAAGYKVPITRYEVVLKRPARLEGRLDVTALLRPPETAKLVMDYEVRERDGGALLATGTTEQVLLDPSGQLLLGFPEPVRVLVGRILAYQAGELELPAGRILAP